MKPPPQPLSAAPAPRQVSAIAAKRSQRRRARRASTKNQNSGRVKAARGHLRPRLRAAVCEAAVWMVICVVADELPGVTELGANVAVAPVGRPLAAKVIEPGKVPFCAVAVMVYCADPPDWMVCDAVVELSVKVGADTPVPLSVAVCGEFAALSDTDNVAVKLAADAGVKVTVMPQESPAPSVAVQVSVSAKSEEFVPVMLMLLMVSVAVPGFDNMITGAVAVAATTVLGKVTVAVLSEASGTEGALTVKLTAAEVPPPGDGFVTVTGAVPALAISVARIAAVSWVALT
jgi:hypothetical protein